MSSTYAFEIALALLTPNSQEEIRMKKISNRNRGQNAILTTSLYKKALELKSVKLGKEISLLKNPLSLKTRRNFILRGKRMNLAYFVMNCIQGL